MSELIYKDFNFLPYQPNNSLAKANETSKAREANVARLLNRTS